MNWFTTSSNYYTKGKTYEKGTRKSDIVPVAYDNFCLSYNFIIKAVKYNNYMIMFYTQII